MARVPVIDPVAPPPGDVKQAAPRVADLRGKVIGVRSYWSNFFVFVERLQELLGQRAGVADVRVISVEDERANRMHTQTRTSSTAMPSSVDALAPEKYASFARGVDTALCGLAAWGSCTAWCIHDAISLEEKGVPTLVLVTAEFVALAQSCLKAKGYPHLPMVVLPHPFETLPREEVRRLAEERFEEIVQKMTAPLKQPAPAGH